MSSYREFRTAEGQRLSRREHIANYLSFLAIQAGIEVDNLTLEQQVELTEVYELAQILEDHAPQGDELNYFGFPYSELEGAIEGPDAQKPKTTQEMAGKLRADMQSLSQRLYDVENLSKEEQGGLRDTLVEVSKALSYRPSFGYRRLAA